MLISFTQTYGDRRKLLEIYSKDKRLIEFKNHFDINYYSFHNCSDEVVEYFKSINKVKNTEILIFNGISYPRCLQSVIEKSKQNNCSYFFFSQDDTFSTNNEDIDFEEFFDFIKSYKERFMICLGHSYNSLQGELGSDLKVLRTFGKSILYENNNLNYNKILHNRGGFDDEPYIATFDLVEKLYDQDFFNSIDVWRAEGALTRKWSYGEEIPRHIFNKALFENHNMFGRNNNLKSHWEQRLINKNIF